MKPKKLYLPTMICPVCKSRTGFWKRQAVWRRVYKLFGYYIGNWHCHDWRWVEETHNILVCQECNTQVEVG